MELAPFFDTGTQRTASTRTRTVDCEMVCERLLQETTMSFRVFKGSLDDTLYGIAVVQASSFGLGLSEWMGILCQSNVLA